MHETHGRRGLSGVGKLARERVVEDRAEREHVGRGRHALPVARRLLGRHEGGGSEDGARLGEALARDERGAEVAEERAPALLEVAHDEDVPGLQVAVNDPTLVRRLEGARHVEPGAQRGRDREQLLADEVVERGALDEVHDVPGPPVLHPAGVDPDDVGVAREHRERLDLAPEAVLVARADGLAGDHLERVADAELLVAHDEHRAHAALRELPLDDVGTDAQGQALDAHRSGRRRSSSVSRRRTTRAALPSTRTSAGRGRVL